MNEAKTLEKRTKTAVTYDRMLCAGLTRFQKDLLKQMIYENLFIMEILDFRGDFELTYTLTNGDDDIKDLRHVTFEKLKNLDFINHQILPGCTEILRTKYFINENMRVPVLLACA